jgi:hypothetical protein
MFLLAHFLPSVLYNWFNIVEFRYNSYSGALQSKITLQTVTNTFVPECRAPLPLLIPLSTSRYNSDRYNSNSGLCSSAITVIAACRAPLQLMQNPWRNWFFVNRKNRGSKISGHCPLCPWKSIPVFCKPMLGKAIICKYIFCKSQFCKTIICKSSFRKYVSQVHAIKEHALHTHA